MPAAATMGNHRPLASLDQVNPAPVHRLGLGSSWDRNLQLFPARSVPIGPLAIAPSCRPEVLAPPQRSQIPPRRIANEHDIPAMPPISTIRATTRYMSLAPKRDTPVPASSALNPDFRLVVHGKERLVATYSAYSREKRQWPEEILWSAERKARTRLCRVDVERRGVPAGTFEPAR